MRLTYVIDSVVASGGAEQSLAMLAAQWVRHGYELEVVTLHDRDGLQSRLRADGVTVTHLDASPAQRVPKLRQHLRRHRPDLVHTTLFAADITGRMAAQLAGTPFVSSLVTTGYGKEEYANPALKTWKLHAARAADAATLRSAQGVHAVSRHVAMTTAKRLWVPDSKVTVIPRARDERSLGEPSVERRATTRRRLGVDDRTPVILIAARHEFAKGIDVAIEAMDHLASDVLMLVAGRTGAATELLLERARGGRASDRIQFLGSRDDVADLLVAADVCLVPSRREGMPGTVLEAMCLQTPLVVSDIGPNREALGGPECGWLARLDPQALAASVTEALEDRSSDRPRRARQRFADNYSLNKVVQQMMGFHERAAH